MEMTTKEITVIPIKAISATVATRRIRSLNFLISNSMATTQAAITMIQMMELTTIFPMVSSSPTPSPDSEPAPRLR